MGAEKFLDNPYAQSCIVHAVAGIFNNIISGCVNLHNSSKQQKMATQQAALNHEMQQENQRAQFAHQEMMQSEGFKQQIANQLRAYKLSNSWPLDTAPEEIADSISMMKGNLPLYMVIAPADQNGFQKSLESMWTQISSFFVTEFRLNSDTPVMLGKYKKDWPTNAMHDYQTIWEGLKGIPTLYLAPYFTERDRVLGVVIATWGFGEPPTINTLEIDLRKLQIDAVRHETEKIQGLAEEGKIQISDFPVWQKNIEIFEREKRHFAQGFDWQELDQTFEIYKDLRVTGAVHTYVADQLLPLFKMMTTCMADIYFVLSFSSLPKFPRVIGTLKKMPDLLVRSVNDENSDFTSVSGTDLIQESSVSYALTIADNAEPLSAVKYIESFNANQPDIATFYEERLFSRCFPKGNSNGFTADELRFLNEIRDIPNIEKTSYFRDLLQSQNKSLQNGNTQQHQEGMDWQRFFAVNEASAIMNLWEKSIQDNPDAMYQLAVYLADASDKSLHFFKKAGGRGHLPSIVLLWQRYGECFSKSEKALVEAMKKITLKAKLSKNFYTKDRIPESKRNNALAAYANYFSADEVLALYDNTFLGGAEDGFVISFRGVATGDEYNQKPQTFLWSEIKKIQKNQNFVLITSHDGRAAKVFVSQEDVAEVQELFCDMFQCHEHYWNNYGAYKTKDDIYNTFPRNYC